MQKTVCVMKHPCCVMRESADLLTSLLIKAHQPFHIKCYYIISTYSAEWGIELLVPVMARGGALQITNVCGIVTINVGELVSTKQTHFYRYLWIDKGAVYKPQPATFLTWDSHPETPVILECMANWRQKPLCRRAAMKPPASDGAERSLCRSDGGKDRRKCSDQNCLTWKCLFLRWEKWL